MADVPNAMSEAAAKIGSVGNVQPTATAAGSPEVKTSDSGKNDASTLLPDMEWKKEIPEELRSQPTFQNLKTRTDVYKMLHETQKMIGKKDANLPNENSTPEEWTSFYRKIGVPEDSKKYMESVKIPETLNKDSDVLKSIITTAHENGLRPAQINKLLESFGEKAIADQKAQQDSLVAERDEQMAGLKKEWGKAYDQNVERAVQGLRATFGPKEADSLIAKFGHDPEFAKAAYKISTLVAEDKIRGLGAEGQSLKTPKEAEKRINAIYADMKNTIMHPNENIKKQHIDELTELNKMLRG